MRQDLRSFSVIKRLLYPTDVSSLVYNVLVNVCYLLNDRTTPADSLNVA